MRGHRSILMSYSLTLAVLATVTLAIPCEAASASPKLTAKALEGVWKVTRVVRTGANAGTDDHPQPSLQIFYRGYYSLIRDTGGEPRKAAPDPEDPTRLTDAEKLTKYEEWAPFAASAGPYEIRGNTIVTSNIIAKQVKGVGRTEEATIRFDGDTFTATAKNSTGIAPWRALNHLHPRALAKRETDRIFNRAQLNGQAPRPSTRMLAILDG